MPRRQELLELPGDSLLTQELPGRISHLQGGRAHVSRTRVSGLFFGYILDGS